MKLATLKAGLFLVCLSSLSLRAQVCDPSTAPTGLTSTYTSGSGALLQWDAVPGSYGVQLRVDLPSGSVLVKRIGSFELDQFFIPDGALSMGTYTWRVQAACSTIPPFSVTPISATNSFMVGSGTCPVTVTDIDGNVYNTVEIGSQCWTQENLKVEHYRNGTNISNLWSPGITSGSFSVYDDVAANKDTYGLLYSWYAVADTRGVCPIGWHVPTDAEWTLLTDFLGGAGIAGGKMKTTGTLGAGTGLWQDPNTDATNSSGFSGLPGGVRNSIGFFLGQGLYGHWWSSSPYPTEYAWYRILHHDYRNAIRSAYYKRTSMSIRCLRD